ncbi:phosphoribosylglycinamide synthetase [Streptomyces sp. NPDC005648]|uniref:ATP-grasp domain-containing protein n=1 Tax=Streptomyces sp. NPDC005648 TaxID=3157044 RepID=UPI0033BA06D7
MNPPADRRLLLVQPCHTSVARAVAAGFRVWAVQDPALCGAHCRAETARLAQALLPADTGDPAALAALLGSTARRHGIDRALHLGGRCSRAAALAAADAAGLSMTSAQSVRRISDRTAMRRLLNENGRAVVRAREARSLSEVSLYARALGVPAVVKHTDAAGRHQVARIACPADLAAWTARRKADATPGPYLLEEYLPGPAFGVHTLTVDGAHHVLAITSRRACPAPDDRLRAELRSSARALLDLADYRFGPAYTQLVLTPEGPRVVAAEPSCSGSETRLFRALADRYPLGNGSGTRGGTIRDVERQRYHHRGEQQCAGRRSDS